MHGAWAATSDTASEKHCPALTLSNDDLEPYGVKSLVPAMGCTIL